MWLYVIIGVVVVCIIAGFAIFIIRNNKINNEGIEAQAVVSRVKEIENREEDGTFNTRYEYFVKYTTESGETVEAKLRNAPRFMKEGDELKIKYLPDKPKSVMMVKE